MFEGWLQQIQNRVDRTSLLAFRGKCDSGMSGSTTDIYCIGLSLFGNDYFNDKFYLQVIKNANSVGNAPEKEIKKITDYTSSTGKFVTEAFSANVEEADEIAVIHESLALIFLAPDASLARVADNSILAQIMAKNGDVSNFDDTTHSLEALAEAIATPGYGVGNTQHEIGDFGDGTADNYVEVTADDVINTFGDWTQLIASTANDSFLNNVYIKYPSTTNIHHTLEIGIGAAASETTIIRVPFICVAALVIYPIIPALKIESGTRISARVSTSNISYKIIYVNIGFQEGL